MFNFLCYIFVYEKFINNKCKNKLFIILFKIIVIELLFNINFILYIEVIL